MSDPDQIDPRVQRDMWAPVAEATARHRWLMAGEAVCYGDPAAAQE